MATSRCWEFLFHSPTTPNKMAETASRSSGAETPSSSVNDKPDSIIRRSWVAMADMLSPFSPSALATLPRTERPVRYMRADAIPHTDSNDEGQRPTVRDYHAINSLPPRVRVPKKISTPIRVEGKVWFANERSEWVCDYYFFVS